MKLTQKRKIFRRLVAAMLAFVLLLSFASCKKDDTPKIQADEIIEPQKKVAILVAPEAQYPEDYKAAAELAEKYPDTIVIKEYADSRILTGGDPGIITLSKELAADSEIGAIVYARAVQYTTNAIAKAKEINPDIVTVCIEPEDSIDDVADFANLVYCVDWAKAAEDIVAQAKEQGAKYFVVFSLNRHISNNALIRSENEAIKSACEAQGITYIYDSSYDPNYSGKIEGAQKYIKEAVARLYLNKDIDGEDVVLFSTDSSVQSTLVELANSKGLIYICPSFPTAYNGVGEVYDIAKPESIADVAAYIENAKTAVDADAEGKGRLNIYKFPLAATLLEGAVHSAFDLLNGTMTADNMADKATVRALAAAESNDFTISAYGKLTNTFMAYQAGFEKIK